MDFRPLNGRMSTALRAFRFPNLLLAPLALWLLTMISLPIVGWVWGEDALIRGMSVGVVMQAGAVIVILYAAWGWKPSLRAILLVAVSTYLAELLGSKTGFPFGRYHYTDLLQPQLMGVPLLIPLAWLMMLPPAWAIAALILQKRPDAAGPGESFVSTLKFALLSALAITAWTCSWTRKWWAGGSGFGRRRVRISAFPSAITSAGSDRVSRHPARSSA